MKLALLWVALALAPPAPVVDRKWGYQVEIPDGWAPVPLEGAPPEVLLHYADEARDRILVVSKVVGPNEEEPSLELVEAGFKEKAQRYKRLSARKRAVGAGRKHKITAWDLWFRLERDGRPVTMGARVLFYKSYALSILVDVPGKARPGGELKKIVESFVPPPPLK